MKKVISLTLWILAITTGIHARGTRTVTDMGGRKVQIPAKVKSVFVDKHCAVMVYAFDPNIAVNRVFEASSEAAKYLRKEYLSHPYTEGADEEILKLHPDLIISSDEINAQSIDKANKLQEKLHIPVVLVEMNMLKYKQTFAFLGKVINAPQRTQELSAFITTYLDKIGQRAKLIPAKSKVRVYYAEGPKGLNTDPSGSKHSQIIDFVGATNVAQVGIIPGKGLSAVSMEQIMVWKPQVILVWSGMFEDQTTYKYILTDPMWSNQSPVKTKRVYQIPGLPFGWFDRPPGTNRILGTIWTANLLYPNIFKYDMVKVTQEYFRKFYHYNLSVAEAKILLNPRPAL